MKKKIGMMIGSFLILVIIALSSPRVGAGDNKYSYANYQQGYQKATVMYVENCSQDGPLTLCMAIIKKGEVEVPTAVTGSVSIGDSVYKECRKKLGTNICSDEWKPWIGEAYLLGGEI
ncbi:hypothetical protein CF8_0158 [Aeromonas phage CF8]|nr:hypothetical protein CF8_0158 [Aeromonas phage CF8]